MSEEKFCHICGTKFKKDETVCKKCKADPDERIVADCRGMRYANSFIVSAYLNIVLTDRRLLGFEDIKGALMAGTVAGVAGGLGGVAGSMAAQAIQARTGGSPIERPVAKGKNGALKFEAPLSALVGITTESKKGIIHTFINLIEGKPLRVVLGTSFDGEIDADLFSDILLKTIENK